MTRTAYSFLLLLFTLPAGAETPAPQAASYPQAASPDQYLIADRDAEIALARSAAPPSVSARAEVLVLGKRGYETAIRGQNGFVCFVERSWTAGFDEAEFWNSKLLAPNCFNPPAARSVLPQYLKRAEWVMSGDSKAQIVEKSRREFAQRHFVVPEPGSLTFMLSRRGYLSDSAAGPWLPHIMMFVAPGRASDWAAGLDGSPILGRDGREYEPTVLLIPVRRWSDGSPAPPAEAER